MCPCWRVLVATRLCDTGSRNLPSYTRDRSFQSLMTIDGHRAAILIQIPMDLYIKKNKINPQYIFLKKSMHFQTLLYVIPGCMDFFLCRLDFLKQNLVQKLCHDIVMLIRLMLGQSFYHNFNSQTLSTCKITPCLFIQYMF